MNSTACTDASQNVLDMGIDLDTLSDSTNASVKNGVYYFRVLEEKKSSNGCKGECFALLNTYKGKIGLNRRHFVLLS